MFALSKILGFFVLPSNLFFLIAACGVVLLFTRFARAGRRIALLGVVLLGVAGYSPLGNVMMIPLEQRFPPWDASRGAPDGIVVLGGSINPVASAARGEVALNESAERLTVIADLARRYPQARIVFSGGDGSMFGGDGAEATHALPLLVSFGIARQRIELESASRTTAENAMLSKVLVNPKPGERWLLVTSAHHMPRSIASFRSAGFPVEAYPVDWRTRGTNDLGGIFRSPASGLGRTDTAAHEWAGLAVYWITGRTSELLPGPR